MKTYKVAINNANGGRVSIIAESSAKTEAGLARAIGKQIANTLHTDIFEVVGILSREGVARDYRLNSWSRVGLTKSFEHYIWKAAHDAIMDGMLV